MAGPRQTIPWGFSTESRRCIHFLRTFLAGGLSLRGLCRASRYLSSSSGSRTRTSGMSQPNMRRERRRSSRSTAQSSGHFTRKYATESPGLKSQYSTTTACSANCRTDVLVCGSEKPETRSKHPRARVCIPPVAVASEIADCTHDASSVDFRLFSVESGRLTERCSALYSTLYSSHRCFDITRSALPS